jgi:hypothetical protein
MNEALRALAVLAEVPGSAAEVAPVAAALGLPEVPDLATFTEVLDLQLPPYASIWLGDGAIGGEPRARIADFLALIGVEAREPDHLAVLLAVWAGLDEAPLRARQALVGEHLASWLPAWLAAMDRLGVPFFTAWGGLVGATLREAVVPGPLPAHFRDLPPNDDPIATLLSPARSGLILARADIARLARVLGMGFSVRDRRAALESMLGQDAAEVGAAFAKEARAQAVAVRAWPEAAWCGWPERAEATARWLAPG